MNLENIDRESLVDIQDISIDTTLPKEERMRDFIRQVKNPYLYRYGKYVVKIAFSETDITLEQRLADYVRAKCAAG
jgi:lysozyme family protein